MFVQCEGCISKVVSSFVPPEPSGSGVKGSGIEAVESLVVSPPRMFSQSPRGCSCIRGVYSRGRFS